MDQCVCVCVCAYIYIMKIVQLHVMTMSTSAERRGITPKVFAALGRTHESSVAACRTRLPVVFDSVIRWRQHFKFDSVQTVGLYRELNFYSFFSKYSCSA